MIYLALVFMLLQLSDIFMTLGLVNLVGPQVEANPLVGWAWASFGYEWSAVAKLLLTGGAAIIMVWKKMETTMYACITIMAVVVLWNILMFWRATLP